jgi:hypothetical protein
MKGSPVPYSALWSFAYRHDSHETFNDAQKILVGTVDLLIAVALGSHQIGYPNQSESQAGS